MRESTKNIETDKASVVAGLNKRLVTPKVIIDGVEYVPAKEALANRDAIARTLLQQFWGDCDAEKIQELIDSPDIKVLVHDWDAGGVSLSKVLDAISKEA